jgi:ACS family hexuronate transporter-like MFS transporter
MSSPEKESEQRDEMNPVNSMVREEKPPKHTSPGRVRWWIVWTLFFSTVINYISRQTFSVLAPMISAQYHLSHTDLSKIFGAFQFSYAVTWLLGGIFLDAVGTRLGLAIAVVFWSVVNILTGFASSVFGFASFRFLLGIGEGLNWPGASKTVAEWFPSQERSLAVAIFDSGSSVGGAVAALSIPLIAIKFGWQAAFVVTGLLGFIWLLMWLRVYHTLDRHPRVTPEEVAYIRAGQEVPRVSAERGLWRWIKLLGQRNVWGIVLGRALTDPIWWFYVFWLPQYLSDARGFSLQRIALFAWMPFVAADLGNFTGGLISGYCIRRGIPVVRARLWVCVFSCLPILAGIPAASVHSVYTALGLICFALWGYASWSTMGLTLPSDLFPQDVVATVTGLSGLAAGMVGFVFTIAVGILVDRFSYGPAFLVAGLMPLFATASVLLLIRTPKISIVANQEV